MTYYQPNPACHCGRCTTRGLTWPAVLITLGVLFLLANTSDFPMERTWPILLIVIGGIRVLRYVIPSTGHVNPGLYPPPPYAGQYPPPPYPGQYPPPPYQAGPYAGSAPNAAPGYSGAAPNAPQTGGPGSGVIVTPPPPPIAGALGDGSQNDEVHNG